MRVLLCLAFGLVSSLSVTKLRAQHSDIEFTYSGGVIDMGFGFKDRIFEGLFPTSGLSLRMTDDPGFASEVDEGLGVSPNALIGYNVFEPLFYWNGVAEATTDATVTFDHHLSAIPNNIVSQASISFSTASFTPGSLRNIIDQADGAGNIHQHIDWSLSELAPFGAYGVVLSLSTDTPGIGDSETFGVIWNYGLSETQFEAGVQHFISTRNLVAVPEPSSLALLAMASGTLGFVRKRRPVMGQA